MQVDSRFPGTALVIVGHGSTTNPDSSEPNHLLADAIRARGLFDEVHCCFWKEEPSMREILHMVSSSQVYVVPNFISEGYFTQTVIPRELELTGAMTRRGGMTIRYCEPVGNHPLMTSVLLKRAAETAPGIPPGETSLLIVGHGTNLNDNSAKAAKSQVALISAMGLYAEVLPAYMEEAPLISDWATMTSQQNVVVLPFFISDGLHSYQDIPVLLGIREEVGPAASQSEVFKSNPQALRGKNLFYGSAIGTDPMMAEVILDQVRAFDLTHQAQTAPNEQFITSSTEVSRGDAEAAERDGSSKLGGRAKSPTSSSQLPASMQPSPRETFGSDFR